MKKQLVIAAAVLVSVTAFGQKKELKKAEKAFAKKDLVEAVAQIKAAEALLASADNKTKVQFYTAKGEIMLAEAKGGNFAKMKEAADAFSKAQQLDTGNDFTDEIANGTQNTRVALVNSAVKDQSSKNYKLAAEKLALSYEVKKDTSDLYFAAINFSNGKDEVKSLESFKKLLDMGYTGIKKEYSALRIADEKIESWDTAEARNSEMISGKYTSPTEGMSESLRGGILRTIVLMESNNGNKEGAMALIKEARDENPNDVSLMRTEASIAYELGDVEKAAALMKEILAIDPTNPEQFFNAGVMSAKGGDLVNARKYYEQALKLDPSHESSMINMSILVLAPERQLVDEMNGLGMSKADTKKYDALTLKREAMYKEALPYLKASSTARPNDVGLMKALMNAYSQLGMDAENKALKSKISELEGN